MVFWGLIIRDYWQRKDSFWLRLIALLVVCSGLATFTAIAQTSEVVADKDISEHWRGAYDILVRPKTSISVLEQETGLVEGNYLGTPEGGITQEQYELIKTIADVDVAAPISTIGFLLNHTGSIGVRLQPIRLDTLYYMEMEFQAAEVQGVRQLALGFPHGAPDDPHNWLVYGMNAGSGNPGDPNGEFEGALGALPPLWTLVAGVDPEQESKLIGLENTIITGEYLAPHQTLEQTYDNNFGGRKAVKIPVIVSKRSFLNGKVTVTVKSLPVTDTQIWNRLLKANREERGKLLAEMEPLFNTTKSQFLVEESVEIDTILRPLAGMALTFSNEKQVEAASEGFFSVLNTNVLLYPGAPNYTLVSPPQPGMLIPTMSISNQGQWGELVVPRMTAYQPDEFKSQKMGFFDIPRDAPLFRPITVNKPPAFVFDVQGTYDFQRLIAPQDPLAYVPLGIYEPPLGLLRFDDSGNPIEPEILTPDLNPAGFIPRPPLALTTLEGSQYLRDREDFIDAIRVRVGGIDRYTPENVAKVEKVASEIAERTDLHVDIVAGSSPQKVLVRVPGLGYVEEQWTTLGAAARITSGLNVANLTLFSTLLVATGLFLANLSQVTVLGRWEEIGLLKAVGWRTRHVVWLLLSNFLLTGLLAALIAALASLALNMTLGLRPSWPVILWISLSAPILYTIAALIPVLRVARQAPGVALQQGEVGPSHHFSLLPLPFNFVGLALRQVWRRRTRALLSILVMVVGTSLAVVLLAVILDLQGKLRVTFLGEYVALNMRPYHYLMIATGLSMGIMAVLENLLLGVLERSREFGLLLSFGWRTRHVMFSVIWEGITIGALGGLPGVSLGAVLFRGISGQFPEQIWLLSLLSVTITIILGMLAAVYPAILARRMVPVHVLAGPANNKSIFPQRFASARWATALLISAIFLAGIGGLGGRKEVVKQILDIGPSIEKSLHPALRAVSGEGVLEHAGALVKPGPRALGNLAEQEAAEYIISKLQSYGLQVNRDVLPLTAITLYGSRGKSPLFTFPGSNGKMRGIALHMNVLRSDKPLKGPVMFIPKGKVYPPAEETVGNILFVQEEELFQWRDNALQKLVEHYGAPAPYLGAVSVYLEEPLRIGSVLQQEELTGSIPVGENIIAVLPGKERPDEEIWIIARYDSSPDSPGADLSGSGTGLLLELARIFAEKNSPVTLRFIALTGTYTGLDGATQYLLKHNQGNSKIKAVLVFEQVGVWDKLVVGRVLSAPDSHGKIPAYEELTEMRQKGLSFLKPIWVRQLDLDQVDLPEWIQKELERNGGLAESPGNLIEQVLKVAQSVGVSSEVRAYPSCSLNYLAFLYRDLPTLVVCGEGNGLIGSEFDTLDTLRPEKLRQALALGYQTILELTEKEE